MIRKLILALGLTATAATAQGFDLEDMSAAERAAFGEAVRAYLLENPGVIFEAARLYEKQQAEAQASNDADVVARNAEYIFNDGRSWVGGNPEGDITVVEFVDYRCGYCKKAFAEVKELISSDGNIRFIVKEFPILGEESTLATRFAIAVRNSAGSDAYAVVHDELMAMRGSVTDASLRRIAQTAGLDFDVLIAAMEDPAVDEEITANYALARVLDINGTPGFIFGSEVIRGYAPLDAMREIVAGQRG